MLMSRGASGSRRSGLARCLALLAFAAASASCGGGGSAIGGQQPSSSLAALCASPRHGIDPATGAAYRDRQGTVADEKAWLRAWTDELYLWYREVPSVDPASYATPLDYFAVLRTPATTPSGRRKDQFHFALPTADSQAQFQAGAEVGYGVRWEVVASRPPREVRVAYVEPSLPAANVGANLLRGAQVLAVDGVDVVNGGDAATLNAGLFPSAQGESHTLVVLDAGGVISRPVTLTSAVVTTTPVQNVKLVEGTTVGYLQFNDHFATAEAELIAAVHQLQAAGATDLVLDIRYNGGGFLDIASELAFMVAGPAATAGKTFEKIVFNDKYPDRDPVTGNPVVTPFRSAAVIAVGQALPHLDLPRVFVLTGPGTCSASESIINSLEGVDVQVIQVGAATCGKPYGFYPQDNCGTTYFSIQFQGVNAKGFGDYADGFTPGGSGAANPPGCLVADDWGRALGDPLEGRLAAALTYRLTQTCPPAAVALARGRAALRTAAATDGAAVERPPWRENRILRR
jgi:carboxyl-terminal processing protease